MHIVIDNKKTCAVFLYAVFFFLSVGIPVSFASETGASCNAAECRLRGGLPNFYGKIARGKNLKIAYFGGSITNQSGWRVLSLKYFKDKFPKSNFDGINAAIGGTNSFLGAFRLKHDVLEKNPDLVFVEFAVNDSSSGRTNIIRAMEGIVRQIWKHNPKTDICFVYTFTEKDLADRQAGRMSRSQAAMEEVADRYGIPSVDMCLEVARLEKEGKLAMKTDFGPLENVAGKVLDVKSDVLVGADGKIPFSKDGVHPYPNTGHVIYTRALVRSLEKIEVQGGVESPHSMGAPMDTKCLENTEIISPDMLSLSGGKKIPLNDSFARPFNGRLPHSYAYIFSPGETIEFKFRGGTAALYVVLGYCGGSLDVEIDGKERRIFCYDAYAGFLRVGVLGLVSGGNESDLHSVKIKVSADDCDKYSVLKPNYKKHFERNRELYKSKYLVLGALLLSGRLEN